YFGFPNIRGIFSVSHSNFHANQRLATSSLLANQRLAASSLHANQRLAQFSFFATFRAHFCNMLHYES
ncbi:MAG: hypothetical protein RSE98_04840, partial [Anaerovoracaceae bacterium]